MIKHLLTGENKGLKIERKLLNLTEKQKQIKKTDYFCLKY